MNSNAAAAIFSGSSNSSARRRLVALEGLPAGTTLGVARRLLFSGADG